MSHDAGEVGSKRDLLQLCIASAELGVPALCRCELLHALRQCLDGRLQLGSLGLLAFPAATKSCPSHFGRLRERRNPTLLMQDVMLVFCHPQHKQGLFNILTDKAYFSQKHPAATHLC